MLARDDDQNLELLRSGEGQVEARNKLFYNRFQFPPAPHRLYFFTDPQFELSFLNQNLGDWSHRRIPARPSVLVAGCGSYQALIVALQLPSASVLGSDLADASLATCQSLAQAIGLRNLTVKKESLIEADHDGELDYIVCTGVIHHLENPEAGLRALARALKPQGVLELMVYNRYHRIPTSAYQRAIRQLLEGEPTDDLDQALAVTQRLFKEHPMPGRFGEYVQEMNSEVLLADTFLQPIEHSYTIESLAEMADRCGLEILCPYLSLWEKTQGSCLWTVDFKAPELRERYEALDDLSRWKIAQWLFLEKSPLLWFYLQRKDSGVERKSERQIDEEFLDTPFRRARATRREYRREPGGSYALWPKSTEFPVLPPGAENEKIIAAADGKTPMRDLLRQLGITPEPAVAHRLRIELTTSTFPYLIASRPG
jgi:SAM-dependent methyltransferase